MSSEKLKKLGWSFRPLEETIADAIGFCQRAGFLGDADGAAVSLLFSTKSSLGNRMDQSFRKKKKEIAWIWGQRSQACKCLCFSVSLVWYQLRFVNCFGCNLVMLLCVRLSGQ